MFVILPFLLFFYVPGIAGGCQGDGSNDKVPGEGSGDKGMSCKCQGKVPVTKVSKEPSP